MKIIVSNLLVLFLFFGSYDLSAQTFVSPDITSDVVAEKLSSEEMQRLDPTLRNLLAWQRSGGSELQSEEAGALLSVIIHTNNPDELREQNFTLHAEGPGFVTSRIFPHQIEALAGNESVRFVTTGHDSQLEMDYSLIDTGAYLLHSGVLDGIRYTGKDVIVAIYDTGIDWRHPDFRNPENPNETRIIRIWDQLHEAEGDEVSPPEPFNYGVEYSREDIELALATGSSAIRSEDTHGHGTHVAGTVAANRGAFTGVAPESDILVIKGGDFSFRLADIVNGIAYAHYVGIQENKPVVVNLSLGGHGGGHDGFREDEQMIDFLSQNPGFAVVNSAGNSGTQLIHFSGMTNDDEVVINVPNYQPAEGAMNDVFFLDIWMDGYTPVEATVTAPSGFPVTRAAGETGISPRDEFGTIELNNIYHEPSDSRNIELWVYDAREQNPPASGTWALSFSGEEARYDGWIVLRSLGSNSVTVEGADTEMTVTMPGTSREVITVGAYVTKNNWLVENGSAPFFDYMEIDNIAGFSSSGPTRDQRQKPDISAPGQAITSPRSSFSSAPSNFTVPGGYRIFWGTSMSAPHVVGAAALLFEANPFLTAAEIKELLIDAARSDEFAAELPHPRWGFGKMDILRCMKQLTGYQEEISHATYRYYGLKEQPANNRLFLENDMKAAVRFTPEFDGMVSSVQIHTLSDLPESGSLIFSVHESSGGQPGVQTGYTATVSLGELSESSFQIIDLFDAEAQVSSGNDYFLVFYPGEETPGFSVMVDQSGTSSESRSYWYMNGWGAFNNGQSNYIATISTVSGPDDIFTDLPDEQELPQKTELYQNYPNPFNPTTQIRYSLAEAGEVSLNVYDITGRRVAGLISGHQQAGNHSMMFDGSRLASGVYLIRLVSNEALITRKMMLIK